MAVLTTDEEIRESGERSKGEPPVAIAQTATYIVATDQIAVTFDNGIEVRFPRASIRELADKTPEQIGSVMVAGAGLALQWEEFDLACYLPNMMDGFAPSCRTAAAEFGRLGGSQKSQTKTAAVRANGKKGGRPKKRTRSAIVSAPISDASVG
jgi:hypothetical protein